MPQFRMLRGRDVHDFRCDRHFRMQDGAGNVDISLNDFPGQPRPEQESPPADVDGVTLVVNDVHSVGDQENDEDGTKT